MGTPTFSALRATFTRADAPSGCRCIAWQCPDEIDTDQFESARAIFRCGLKSPTLKQVRDIIACLVCVKHQRDYSYKNLIERQWQEEFPSLDFTLRRSPSRFSLVSAGKQMASRRTSFASVTPTRRGRQASSTPSIDENIFLRTPDRASPLVDLPRNAVEPTTATALSSSPEIVIHTTGDQVGSGEPASPVQDLPQRVTPIAASESIVEPIVETNDVADTLQPNDGLGGTTGVRSHSTARRRRVSSSADGFCAGDCSTWAVWTIRAEVRALVLEPLPKPNDRGCIYIVEDVDTKTHVKIGMTMRPFRTRLAEITRQHKRQIDEGNAFHIPGIPYVQLLRLEALVHAGLAQYQCNLTVRNGSTRRTHREWFEVDMPTAQKTVRMWWDIMRNIGIKPGVELEPAVCEALHSSPAFDIEMADSATAGSDQLVIDVKAEHTERIRVWTDLLLSRHREAGSWGSSSIARWMIGCALLWILPELMGLAPSAAYLCQATGVALWTRQVFSHY